LPAVRPHHKVADFEFRVLRFDHFAHGAADHHLVEFLLRGIGLGVVHAPAHIRVERKIVDAHQDLPLRGFWDGRGDDLEILFRHPAYGAAGEQDLRIGSHGEFLL